MALPPLVKSSDLITFLTKHQHQIEFFQLMRIMANQLRKEFPDQTWEESFDQYIRIRPSLSVGFPNHELSSIEVLENHKISVETTFFGLYGVSSPLPNFYSEDLISAKQSGYRFLRDFFDLFHHAMYPLLLAAMTRYKVDTGLDENLNVRQQLRRTSWLGISSPKIAEQFNEWPKMLKIASLLSTAYCSISGLRALISTLVGSGAVKIIACPKVRAAIPRQFCFRLGKQNHQLGSEAVLGHSLNAPNNNHIDVELMDQSHDDLVGLLPGGSKYQLIRQSLVLYVPAHFKLCFKIRANTWPSPLSQTALGYGASLGNQVRSQHLAFYIS